MPTTSLRNVASAPSRSPAASRSRSRSSTPDRVVARPRRRRRALVRDDPPDRLGQECRPESAAPAVRVPEDVDRPAGPGRQRLGDGGDVLELALDRVRPRSVARGAAATTVDRVDRERASEHRPDDPERRVVRGRAVDEHQRRPLAAREDRDLSGVSSRDRTTIDGAVAVTDRAATRSGCRAGPPSCSEPSPVATTTNPWCS